MHFKDLERTWGWIGFLYNSVWGMGGQREGLFIHNSFTQREESAIYWTDAFKKCLKSPSQQKVWQGELYLCFFSTSGVATSTSKEPWRCCYHHSGQYDAPLTTYSLQLLNIFFKWGWVGKGKKEEQRVKLLVWNNMTKRRRILLAYACLWQHLFR